jgi:DNA-binding transcriptional LysR family regulator
MISELANIWIFERGAIMSKLQNDLLDGLVALRIVSANKSFTAAAKELGITPSAISQTIKQLEDRLGVTLLSRTTRSISLTEAGEKFLNEAIPAIDQIVAAIDNVGDFATKAIGTLRLNLPRAAYRSFFQPAIKSFKEKYPDVTVELFFEDAKSDVVGSGFDAGVRLSDIVAKDMVAIKLFGPINFVAAGSPKYLEKYGRPINPKDLLSHKCILTRLSTGIYDRWEFENKGKEIQVHVKGSLIMNESGFQINAAIDDQGLIYTTEDSIRNEIKSGQLEIVLEKYKTSSSGYYLYYPKKSQVMPKLRVFIDHIQKERINLSGL